MCNTAAYVGTQTAAPILLEMIQKQEGIGGGHYTGLATIHEGKLHYRKVVGDSAHLRATTDAEALPGAIGICHSRTPSGGDVEWGQPFVNCEQTLAYLAQGSMGYWEGRTDTNAMAASLAAKGHTFRAVADGKIGKYPVLPDGRCVHMSELMCHAISDALDETGDPEEAIRTAFTNWPAEIMGFYLTQRHPDAVFGARCNQPVCIGRGSDGTYMASTPRAFPDHVAWRMWLPPSSVVAATVDGVRITGLGPASDAIVDDIDACAVRELVLARLQEGPVLASDLFGPVKALSARTDRVVACDAFYQVLPDLEREGIIGHEMVRVDGSAPGLTAPKVKLFLK